MPDLLQVSGLRAGYGATVILEDIDLSIAPQRAVAVLGRNGVGKTTLLATLMDVRNRHHRRIDEDTCNVERNP